MVSGSLLPGRSATRLRVQRKAPTTRMAPGPGWC